MSPKSPTEERPTDTIRGRITHSLRPRRAEPVHPPPASGLAIGFRPLECPRSGKAYHTRRAQADSNERWFWSKPEGLASRGLGPDPIREYPSAQTNGAIGRKGPCFLSGTGVKELSARLRHPSFRPIAGVGSCRETVSPDGLSVALSTHRA
jgi:hypothetical protein